jgi:hypothetical protein
MKTLFFKLKVCYLILFTKNKFLINHIKDNQPVKFYDL